MTSINYKNTASDTSYLQQISSPSLEEAETPSNVIPMMLRDAPSDVPTGNTSEFPPELSTLVPSEIESGNSM